MDIMKKSIPKLPDRVMLAPKQRDALFYFARHLKHDLKDRLIALMLYGSRARGNARPNSDIDVLVVLKGKSRKGKDIVIDWDVKTLLKYEVLLSERIMSEKQYEYEKNLPSLFMQFVENEGISLI